MNVSVDVDVRRDRHLYLFMYEDLIGKLPLYTSAMLHWPSGLYHTQ